ncbi:ectin [Magallana gigas]|uniref:ectin n=1 Tax=Magallana gigas TaxID=29159 RepID=UPI00333FBB94
METFASIAVVVSLWVSGVLAGSWRIAEHACTTLSCGSNQFLDITYAFYGIQYWCDASNEVGILDSRCYRKQSCQICATNSWYGDPCPGTSKYLWYNYDCINIVVDGAWGDWTSWGGCSTTCGGGRQSRSRICDNPRPANGGKTCSGSSADFQDCNTAACPTAAPGQYLQLCPSGYFTCQSGSMSCIQNEFQCDCSADCDDGSDEDATYAGCTNTLECLAKAGAGTTVISLTLICLAFFLSLGMF